MDCSKHSVYIGPWPWAAPQPPPQHLADGCGYLVFHLAQTCQGIGGEHYGGVAPTPPKPVLSPTGKPDSSVVPKPEMGWGGAPGSVTVVPPPHLSPPLPQSPTSSHP